MGALCDHSSGSVRLQQVVSSFSELTDLMQPSGKSSRLAAFPSDSFPSTAGPLDLELLKKLSARAGLTHSLAEDTRMEFVHQFRRFLMAAVKQNDVLGTQGMAALYPEDIQPLVLDAFNAMISDFNLAMSDPVERMRLATGNLEEGEVEETPAEKVKGKGSRKVSGTGSPAKRIALPVPEDDEMTEGGGEVPAES
jgi:hypothetical protein